MVYVIQKRNCDANDSFVDDPDKWRKYDQNDAIALDLKWMDATQLAFTPQPSD